jgi:hypothetical protein
VKPEKKEERGRQISKCNNHGAVLEIRLKYADSKHPTSKYLQC